MKDYNNVILTFLVIAFFIIIGFSIQASKTADFVNISSTIIFAFFTMLLWWTNIKIKELNQKMADLNERNVWLTGSLESHSHYEFIMRAHEQGIPVMWWDPNKEAWDPNMQPWHPGRKHRQLVNIPLLFIYLPEGERSHVNIGSIPVATPFTDKELADIEAERERLR